MSIKMGEKWNGFVIFVGILIFYEFGVKLLMRRNLDMEKITILIIIAGICWGNVGTVLANEGQGDERFIDIYKRVEADIVGGNADLKAMRAEVQEIEKSIGVMLRYLGAKHRAGELMIPDEGSVVWKYSEVTGVPEVAFTSIGGLPEYVGIYINANIIGFHKPVKDFEDVFENVFGFLDEFGNHLTYRGLNARNLFSNQIVNALMDNNVPTNQEMVEALRALDKFKVGMLLQRYIDLLSGLDKQVKEESGRILDEQQDIQRQMDEFVILGEDGGSAAVDDEDD